METPLPQTMKVDYNECTAIELVLKSTDSLIDLLVDRRTDWLIDCDCRISLHNLSRDLAVTSIDEVFHVAITVFVILQHDTN